MYPPAVSSNAMLTDYVLYVLLLCRDLQASCLAPTSSKYILCKWPSELQRHSARRCKSGPANRKAQAASHLSRCSRVTNLCRSLLTAYTFPVTRWRALYTCVAETFSEHVRCRMTLQTSSLSQDSKAHLAGTGAANDLFDYKMILQAEGL
jgi:hypothetical protein